MTVEPAHPVPAPTLERQGDAESREDEVALRAEIARSIEEAGVEYASTLSWISTEDDRKRYVAAMAFARAARIARGSSS